MDSPSSATMEGSSRDIFVSANESKYEYEEKPNGVLESCEQSNSKPLLPPNSFPLPESIDDLESGNNGNVNRRLKRVGTNMSNHQHCHHQSNHFQGHNHANERSEPDDMSESEKEAHHFQKVVTTFKFYKKLSLDKLRSTERYVRSLPLRHQDLLSDYLLHLNSLKACIEVNQNLFQLFVHEETSLFENQEEFYPTGKKIRPIEQQITSLDFDRLQAVLKHIVRDWSEIGAKERASCHSLIINELILQFPDNRANTRVLVPGAGMGRLAHEIVRLGFETQGNEFSLLMLFASNFILNKCYGRCLYKCYPWIHQNSNVVYHKDQMREVTFPDINPTQLPDGAETRFSMTAGDFIEVYSKPQQKEAWDAVVTCFFIDCAHNIVELLENIHFCLKENGVWINLGPLLYHYSDMPNEQSIEPSYDFVVGIARRIGFKVEKEALDLPTIYTENCLSMLNYSYKSAFLVCRKLPGAVSVGTDMNDELN